jgi:cardiolipin synthase
MPSVGRTKANGAKERIARTLDQLRLQSNPEREGNQVTLLINGQQYFPDLLDAIRNAKFEIRIETYIFANDSVGESMCAELQDAATRGVKVRMVLDGFGGEAALETWVPNLRTAGVRVRVFRPEGFVFRPNPWRLRRMHRKIAVIDRNVAWVGGINLIDDFNHDEEQVALRRAEQRVQKEPLLLTSVRAVPKVDVNADLLQTKLGPRYDFTVRLEGPVVQDVWNATEWLWWQIGAGGKVAESVDTVWWKRRFKHMLKVLAIEAMQEPPTSQGTAKAQLVLRDNFRFRSNIERAYLKAIGQAQQSVVIANAYFIPSWRFRRALKKARARGVRICLLLQGQIEYKFQHYATQAMYAEFLAEGIEIYEYMPSFLHSKVAVVDDVWSTVGSSNIDPFSLLLAREANVIVRSREFVNQLREELLHSIQDHSRQVQNQAHLMRPLRERIYSWICYGMLRAAVLLGALTGRY